VGISNVTAIIVQRNPQSGRLSVTRPINWSFGWYAARLATKATAIAKGGTFDLVNQSFFGNYYLFRDFMSFNTGDVLPSDAIISSVSFASHVLSLNAYHDTERKAVLVPTTQQSATNLVLEDFDELTVNDPIEIGRFPLDVTGTKTVDFAAEHFNQIKRSGEVSNNDVDIGWTLLGFRGDLDVDITPIPTFIDINCQFADFSFSSPVGGFLPPHLVINYTLPPDPPEPPEPGGKRKSAKAEKDTSELWEVEASIYSVNDDLFQGPSINKKKYVVPENKIKVIMEENISLHRLESLNKNITMKLLPKIIKE
jgi:hypothetical protein